MASKKPAAKPAATKAAPKATTPQNGPTTETRIAAGKKGAPVAQATRSVVEKPGKPTIAMDAPAAAVDKLIVVISKNGKKFDNDVHSAGMACLYHADKHGDITLMNKLLLALPKSSRRNALAQWAVAMGKFKPNEDKATLQTVPLAFDKSKGTLFDDAQATPFWDFKNVREGTTEWDFGGYITNVKKTLARAMSGTGPDALKAKAMYDAISATEEALSIPTANGKKVEFVPGKTPDRRGTVGSAPATPAPTSAATH